jgi:alpha-acetolactate decarboxylase
MPIILDKKNIPIDAHGKHSHVGIGTATTTDSALSVVNGKVYLGNFKFIV